jgi:hypothetical protein
MGLIRNLEKVRPAAGRGWVVRYVVIYRFLNHDVFLSSGIGVMTAEEDANTILEFRW